jgi:hypothetical protein
VLYLFLKCLTDWKCNRGRITRTNAGGENLRKKIMEEAIPCYRCMASMFQANRLNCNGYEIEEGEFYSGVG